MSYEQEIKELLFEAGKEGLSAKKIARHIFNKHNGLFETTPYDEVYKAVQYCIAKNNKSAKPFIEKAERWGYYKLTEKSSHDTKNKRQRTGKTTMYAKTSHYHYFESET